MESEGLMAMDRLIMILAAALAPSASLQQQGSASEGLGGRDCVPDGRTEPQSFPRPELDQPGVPVNARWAPGGGAPQAYEQDRITGDDPMPSSPGNGDPVDVPVENAGGWLKDGSGKTLNGGSEGDCIELYVEWSYYYPVKVQRGGVLKIGGGSVSKTHCWYVWKKGSIRSQVKQVCPC
jgi:hypothetical protein